MVIADDQTVRDLNRQYRGIDSATDVLSFPMQEGPGRGLCPGLLGDVVISAEQAARQSPDGDLEREIVRLAVHGLCHLMGLDHGTRRETARMRAEEQRLLHVLHVEGGVL